MEAIILAGGLGTRLQSVVSDIPKPMAPIGDKPFLVYILEYLKRNGIKKVILSVGYKWEVIQKYFGSEYKGIKLVYSVEDEPLGTGGAIKQALSYVDSKEIYIINGDTFFNVDLSEFSLENGSMLQLALKTMSDFDRYGYVESDASGYITAFREKGYRKKGDINGGIYLANKNLFDNFKLNERFSFEEFMQENFKTIKVTARVFNNYFIDIGIPEDYKKAQMEIEKQLQ